MNITELSDYPAILQLTRALWRRHEDQSAALFVGAGLSTSAELITENSLKPPLWHDLSREMSLRLYPDPADRERNAPKDPLRLAEEYKAAFGTHAMDEFVREQISDHIWEPSALHSNLLKLPWVEVLTTNYDTLLERAAYDISEQVYSTVNIETDLTHATSPRIIKLHGSIEHGTDFVISEEDYRTYPEKHAAFVNTARQIFIENELCLLGFSGDDPNFLQWSGWVRDRLADGTSRIYLVGVLEISNSKRRLLEARNIAPIDLAPLVKNIPKTSRHSKATELFIQYLSGARPADSMDWNIAGNSSYETNPSGESFGDARKDPVIGAKLLEHASDIWAKERQAYPGWAIAPSGKRLEVRYATSSGLTTDDAFMRLPQDARRCALIELFWRYEVGCEPIHPVIVKLCEQEFRSDADAPPKNVPMEMARHLARHARNNLNKEQFQRWLSALQLSSGNSDDVEIEATYQECLYLLQELDFQAVKDKLDQIQGSDPLWDLRRAYLLVEVGNEDEAKKIILSAYGKILKRWRKDRNSIWIKSRVIWIGTLANIVGRFSSLDAPYEIDQTWQILAKTMPKDPWGELENIQKEANELCQKEVKGSQLVRPSFRPGSYRTPDRFLPMGENTTKRPIDEIRMITETIGLPSNLCHVNISTDVWNQALKESFDGSLNWYLTLIRHLQSHSDSLIDEFFGRIAIACMDIELARTLRSRVLSAIEYWRGVVRSGKRNQVEQLQKYIEILARLSVRNDTKEAFQDYKLAKNLLADQSHSNWWLNQPIGHLAEHNIEGIGQEQNAELALVTLQMPLKCEISHRIPDHHWPNLAAAGLKNASIPKDADTWAARVAIIIEALKHKSGSRAEAALRLVYLAENDLLKKTEAERIATLLWDNQESREGELPDETDLLPHAFLAMPAPDTVNIQSSVSKVLFVKKTANNRQLSSLAGAGQTKGKMHFRPNAKKAVSLFDHFVKFRPENDKKNSKFNPFHGHDQTEKHRLLDSLGKALTYSLVPAMKVKDRNADRFGALIKLISEASCHSATMALPLFFDPAGKQKNRNKKIISIIRKNLESDDEHNVWSAVYALINWPNDTKNGPPRVLVEQLLANIATSRMPSRDQNLFGGRALLEKGILKKKDKKRLNDGLENLLELAQYERLDRYSKEAVIVSFVRKEAVRLANALKEDGFKSTTIDAWMTNGPNDPLPEVRQALNH